MKAKCSWGAAAALAAVAVVSSGAAPGAPGPKAPGAKGPPAKAAAPKDVVLEVVGEVALAALDPAGFEALPLEKKILAYHLGEAAWAGDRIVLDQNYVHNVAIRDLVALVVANPRGVPKPVQAKMRDYLVRLWLHHGVHDGWSGKKFVPSFTKKELEAAARKVRDAGVKSPLWDVPAGGEDPLPALLAKLDGPIFDPAVDAFHTVKDPPPGEDILTASKNNLYEGVTLADLKGFTERYPLNSKLVKKDGKLVELVYRAGGKVDVLDAKGESTGKTVDIPPGLYATELSAVIHHLEAAMPYAEPAQREALGWLVRWFRTGDLADFDRYNVAWVKDAPVVETINGFIESYLDARGTKASYEAVVAMVDEKNAKVMRDLAANALELEKRMPWKDEYKKTEHRALVANAFSVLVESGDGGPLSAIGINLPNAQWIREKHGHKNFLLTNVMAARRAATGLRAIDEFAWDKAEAAEAKRCFEAGGNAMVAMHEVTGHGSGKVSPKLTADPGDLLKEYYSTLEEARADLVALWLAHEPLILKLGVLPDEKCADAMFTGTARSFLLRLRTIPTGDVIEEDHLRAESMILRFAMEKGALVEAKRGGKIYLRVTDPKKFRAAVGELLAEIMRIKAEGDYDAIKALVTKHGSKLDTAWRDDAVKRGKKIKLPVLTAVLPAKLLPSEKEGKIVDVTAAKATKADVTPYALRGGSVPVVPATAAPRPPGGA